MPNGNIIAIANQKGGVGKTTTAVNLAGGLSVLGCSVLLIDCDSQANATTHLGYDPKQFDISLDDLLFEEQVSAHQVIVEREGVDFIPASINLSMADQKFAGVAGREIILSEKLEPVSGMYDYIILDCPPNLGVLSLNAFSAASDIIVTVNCEFFALGGLNQLTEVVSLVQKRINAGVKISGYLCTMYDARKNQHKEVRGEVYRAFPTRAFKTTIRTNSKISESPIDGHTVFEHDPKGQGATDYLNFSTEVRERYGR